MKRVAELLNIGTGWLRNGGCSGSDSMRNDLRQTLDRQAAWQRARSAESWAKKLRTAVIMRQTLLAIRKDASIPAKRRGG